MKHLRGWLLASAVCASAGLFAFAAGENESILKVAEALQKNDADAAKQASQALQKADLDVIMEVFKLRSKGGVGVGEKGAVKRDGIEAKLQDLDKAAPTPKESQADAAALARAGYVSAAVAEVIMNKVPNDKKKQDAQWKSLAKEMHKTGLDFAKAAESKDAGKIQKAAKDLNNACIKCHDQFR